MKTNIKMRVTPEQSMKVQEICFENRIKWNDGSRWVLKENEPYLFILQEGVLIYKSLNQYNEYNLRPEKEIDADLFIRTNGTCEEISDEGLSKIKAASHGKPTEYLQEKIINLHKQINKDRATIKNQKKELHKLNLKLQKCISLEEHDLKIKTVLNKKHYLEKENKSLKESSKISCNTLHSQKDKIDRLELNYVTEQSRYKKEIEKLKAVIEYLESKVK